MNVYIVVSKFQIHFFNTAVLQTFLCNAFPCLFVIFQLSCCISTTANNIGKEIGYCAAAKTLLHETEFSSGTKYILCVYVDILTSARFL